MLKVNIYSKWLPDNPEITLAAYCLRGAAGSANDGRRKKAKEKKRLRPRLKRRRTEVRLSGFLNSQPRCCCWWGESQWAAPTPNWTSGKRWFSWQPKRRYHLLHVCARRNVDERSCWKERAGEHHRGDKKTRLTQKKTKTNKKNVVLFTGFSSE